MELGDSEIPSVKLCLNYTHDTHEYTHNAKHMIVHIKLSFES